MGKCSRGKSAQFSSFRTPSRFSIFAQFNLWERLLGIAAVRQTSATLQGFVRFGKIWSIQYLFSWQYNIIMLSLFLGNRLSCAQQMQIWIKYSEFLKQHYIYPKGRHLLAQIISSSEYLRKKPISGKYVLSVCWTTNHPTANSPPATRLYIHFINET